MFWQIATFTFLAYSIIVTIRLRRDHNLILEQDKVYIDKVLREGIQVFGSEEKFRSWLYSKIRALNFKMPIEILRKPGGTEKILAILGRIEHGIYS